MAYFKAAIDYYLQAVYLTDSVRIRDRCLAKYPRGVNFVLVEGLGRTFTPNHFVDPGRYFLTYERMVNEVLVDPASFPEELKAPLRHEIDTYNPQTHIIWLFAAKCADGGTDWQMSISPVKLPAAAATTTTVPVSASAENNE